MNRDSIGSKGNSTNHSNKQSATSTGNQPTKHSDNINKGKYGEELAAGYLQSQGYQIIFRNFYSKYGELDIVAKKNNCLVFVEVKTRTQDRFGTPGEAVDARKQKHMAYAAKFFIQRFGFHHTDLRFDVVEVQLNHLENI